MKTFKKTIRWVAVLPAAFLAANLGYLAVSLAVWLIYNNTGDWLSPASAKTLDLHVNAFVIPFVFILVGAHVAPSHKFATGIISAVLCWTVIIVLVTLVISGGVIPLSMIPLLWTAGTLCGLFLAHKAEKDANGQLKIHKLVEESNTMNPLTRIWRLISFTFRFLFCEVTPFQCHHCGKIFYAPSEKEMATMMEGHLYESHRAEWEKLLRPGKELKREDFEELVELEAVTPCMPSSHWELTYTKSDGTRNTVSLKDSVEQLAARLMAKEEEHKDHDFASQLVFVNKDGDRLVFTARELKEEYYRVACEVSALS